ncbi:MAG: hypothetical protein Q8N88_03670 [Nanoarchaeota archaeon]|nr:hypothetical protein [Nanoarchaeota archaeon]
MKKRMNYYIQDDLGLHCLDTESDCVFICPICKNEQNLTDSDIDEDSKLRLPNCEKCGVEMTFSYWLDGIYEEELYKKLCVTSELLKNSSNKQIVEFIYHYIQNLKDGELDKEDKKLNARIEYILSSNFDIAGFGIHAIPIHYSYVFHNKQKNQWFDLVLHKDSLVEPVFINVECNEEDALSIEDAVLRYVWPPHAYVPEEKPGAEAENIRT